MYALFPSGKFIKFFPLEKFYEKESFFVSFSLCTDGIVDKIFFFNKGLRLTFSLPERKSYKKKQASLLLDRLAARQLCRSKFFCSRKYRCPVVPISVIPKSKRLEIVGSRKNGILPR